MPVSSLASTVVCVGTTLFLLSDVLFSASLTSCSIEADMILSGGFWVCNPFLLGVGRSLFMIDISSHIISGADDSCHAGLLLVTAPFPTLYRACVPTSSAILCPPCWPRLLYHLQGLQTPHDLGLSTSQCLQTSNGEFTPHTTLSVIQRGERAYFSGDPNTNISRII